MIISLSFCTLLLNTIISLSISYFYMNNVHIVRQYDIRC